MPIVLCIACWLMLPLSLLVDARDDNRRAWPCLVGLGAALLLVGACSQPLRMEFGPPFSLGGVQPSFHMDGLAAWFLAVVALVSLCVSPFLHGYMAHLRGRVDMRLFWACLGLLLASMCAVILAANAQTFLVAWEVMSLSSFMLVLSDHRPRATRRAGLVYLGATRVGTACLAAGFLWAYAVSHSWHFADWHVDALLPAVLILVGLGVKAGAWPFHLWLPMAHPAAPTPVSAIMSGLMVKVALYGIVRFFVLPGGFTHAAIAHVILALGAVSALWGVLFALLQRDLKRLLAYSTVENVGLILLGIGLSLVARRAALPDVAALALAAALLHVLNHAAFKSLLFLCAGAVDVGARTRDLERLGGLARRMPHTFLGFVIGSAAICALPPLCGFASEWLLYRSLLGVAARAPDPLSRFLGLVSVGWVALVGALALCCFTRACGVAFLGQARSRDAEQAHEAGGGMLAAQAALATLCVGLGVAAPAVLKLLEPIVGGPVASAWTLPMPAVLLTCGAFLAVGALLLRGSAVRAYDTWECGFGPLSPRMQISAASFAEPTARLFGSLYRYVVRQHIRGRTFPEEITAIPAVRSILAERVYLPVMRGVDGLARRMVRLQAGSIHFYLFTMFVTLWILVLVGRYL